MQAHTILYTFVLMFLCLYRWSDDKHVIMQLNVFTDVEIKVIYVTYFFLLYLQW
jgi:hypothetical protein